MIGQPHINYKEIPAIEMIYPLTHHKEDYHWIQKQLKYLNAHHRQTVSDEYERLWKSSGHDREVVNTFLREYVKTNGSMNNVRTVTEICGGALPEHIEARIKAIRATRNNKKTILGFADNNKRNN